MQRSSVYDATKNEIVMGADLGHSKPTLTLTMDIPDIADHVLNLGQTSSTVQRSSQRTKSSKSLSKRARREERYRGHLSTAHSSAEDLSTTSDSDQAGYYTTPATSDSSPEDAQPDEVEDFRDREYSQLAAGCYLDHGGATLYCKSMLQSLFLDLTTNLYGNPHSASKPSALAGRRVDEIRDRTLRFFNADPKDFDLVFVANATAGCKLVAECLRDHSATTNTPVWFGYHKDCHTSIVGMREVTKMHRCFNSDEEVEHFINCGGMGGPRARQLGLFAYPGQSNMTGRRLPTNWGGRLRKQVNKAQMFTLFDAAALATCAPLDLSDAANAPDFTTLSFYKIFGYPDMGALIVRKASAHVLENRRYFGGGTVEMVVAVNDTWHAKKDGSIHDRLEDGTVPFHNIIALEHCMDAHERLYGPNPMKFISHHTSQLGKRLYENLSSLKHGNGHPVCHIYKDPGVVYGDPTVQGSTIAFNVMHSDGKFVDYQEVEQAANNHNIFVRSGSLCNPGGIATYLDWSPNEMKAAYAAGHRCSNPKQTVFGKPTGVVRVSLGAMNIAADVELLTKFLKGTYIDHSVSSPAMHRMSSLPHLSTTGALSNIPKRPSPSTAASDHTIDILQWDAIAAASPGSPPVPSDMDLERPPHPRWDPIEYTRRARPWQDEMRKQPTTATYGMEAKSRETNEDGNSMSKNGTPSFRARKFGRSVANFLKPKASHSQNFLDQQQRPPDPHDSTIRSRHTAAETKSQGSGSRRSLERAQFVNNISNLGL